MFLHLRHATQGLRQLLRWLPQCLPSSCALCGQIDRNALCQACRQDYFTRECHRCLQCAMPMSTTAKDIRCGDCLKHKPAFDATLVATDYRAPADQLVLALKFGARLTLAPLLAELLGNALQQEAGHGLPLPALLAPVPLGRRRLQERGFNQSLEIARPLARRFAIPMAPQLLVRLRDTPAQTTLPVDERKRNMRRAFIVQGDAMQQVRDRHIGVVDDAITTGATLNDIAATLKRYGARRVTNLVFARTILK